MKIENQNGFSLIEIVITIFISLIVGTASWNIFISHYKGYQAQTAILDAQQNASLGIDMMVREIKMAGYDPADKAFNGEKYLSDGTQVKKIVEAKEKKIRFLADINGDGNFNDKDDDNEDITYELRDGETTLRRKSRIGGQPLSENIESLHITYLDREGKIIPSPVSDTSVIRMVEIYIRSRTERADPDFKFDDGYRKREIRSSVYLRNL
ncbi:MAG: prepilin-type N-terminal cleavage/methylation domain-containing protein [Nitrospirae bacterium]|nr:prepilin-type N-terminal cleavage/methylation domain-containing protein [Nitrospirota bacterium]